MRSSSIPKLPEKAAKDQKSRLIWAEGEEEGGKEVAVAWPTLDDFCAATEEISCSCCDQSSKATSLTARWQTSKWYVFARDGVPI